MAIRLPLFDYIIGFIDIKMFNCTLFYCKESYFITLINHLAYFYMLYTISYYKIQLFPTKSHFFDIQLLTQSKQNQPIYACYHIKTYDFGHLNRALFMANTFFLFYLYIPLFIAYPWTYCYNNPTTRPGNICIVHEFLLQCI